MDRSESIGEFKVTNCDLKNKAGDAQHKPPYKHSWEGASGTYTNQINSAVGKGASGTYTKPNQQDPERAPAEFKPH